MALKTRLKQGNLVAAARLRSEVVDYVAWKVVAALVAPANHQSIINHTHGAVIEALEHGGLLVALNGEFNEQQLNEHNPLIPVVWLR